MIVVFTDDLGYGDLGCYGADKIPTPRIDRMAEEGLKLNDFYVAAPTCTPSRAALLTGSYPQRVSMPGFVHPHQNHGLNPDEFTLGDLFQAHGYRTACFGKWHLGRHEPHRPPNHGFDESLYIPYSHDMYRNAPWSRLTDNPNWPDYVPLLKDHEEVDQLRGLDDFSTMTRRFNDAALDFIRRNHDEPFFLYLPHPMPHLELKPPAEWEGVAEYGPYGDVIAELDHGMGEIIDLLKELDIDEKTMVIFTSDNGPALVYQRPQFPGGSAGPLRGRKNTKHEGGFRVPCIIRWPGTITAGVVSDEMITAMDLLPTFAAMLGAELPPDRVVDGHNMLPFLENPAETESPYDEFFFYHEGQLMAVRAGEWKLYATRTVYNRDGSVEREDPSVLYNLDEDIGESVDVADRHPEIVARLEASIVRMRGELGDHYRHRRGPQPYPAVAARPNARVNP